nr:hypothetical protein [Mycoplasmopsis bovis]
MELKTRLSRSFRICFAEGKVKSEVTKVVKLEEVADIFEKLQKGEFLGTCCYWL